MLPAHEPHRRTVSTPQAGGAKRICGVHWRGRSRPRRNARSGTGVRRDRGGCAGTWRAVQRSAGRWPGEPTGSAERARFRYHARQSAGDHFANPRVVRHPDRPLRLFQPAAQARTRRVRAGRRRRRSRWVARARSPTGGVWKLRVTDGLRRPVPDLSCRADHAAGSGGTDRQAGQRFHLLRVA